MKTMKDNPFHLGQRWAWANGNLEVRQRRSNTNDLGLIAFLQGWTDCPVTAESVGEELFDDATMFRGRDDDFVREFVRGVLCE